MSKKLSLFALLMVASWSSVYAAVITPFASRALFAAAFPGELIENWDSYAAGTIFPDGSTTAGITYNSSAGDALVTRSFLVSTSPNGLGDTAVGFFQNTNSITFGFSSTLTAFGIDINTFSTGAGAYTATTNLGDSIGSVSDPFFSGGTGEFVGFLSSIPFSSVTIAAVPSAGGLSYTLDTLRYVPGASVPEPSTLALMFWLVAGLGLVARGRARQISSRTMGREYSA